MNWRKVLAWEEAEGNYKLYVVPVSGNEYWPKGGIFFKGTISQIASKLADEGLVDDELVGEQLISNLIASAPNKYNLHVVADNDSEHYALGPEFTPNSSLIVSVMEEWGNEGEEREASLKLFATERWPYYIFKNNYLYDEDELNDKIWPKLPAFNKQFQSAAEAEKWLEDNNERGTVKESSLKLSWEENLKPQDDPEKVIAAVKKIFDMYEMAGEKVRKSSLIRDVANELKCNYFTPGIKEAVEAELEKRGWATGRYDEM